MKDLTLQRLINVLLLKADKKGMYQTAWGRKTIVGLKETIKNIITDSEEEKN
jgi:hypothetical protein